MYYLCAFSVHFLINQSNAAVNLSCMNPVVPRFFFTVMPLQFLEMIVTVKSL